MAPITIRPLGAEPATLAMMSSLLVETVANGGSVSFMHPLPMQTALTFWQASLAAAARGERIVLGAWDSHEIVGTVTLLLDCQPHRGEIAKMMTRVSHRGRGIASALLRAAEDEAISRGRTLLVLDTASIDGASGLYESFGFQFAGEIPDYALLPHGGFTGTRLYWKRIAG